MAEESVVSQEEIRSILTERYRIGEVGNITSLSGGSAHCYRIQTSNGQFVLKEFPLKYTVEELRSEPAITDFVRRHGVPAATFTATTEGEYVWSYRGRAFHLQEFVEGTVFPQNEAPDWLMRESAILLGRLHRALRGFPALRQGFRLEPLTK
jgi:Ser/Thr protein kinase RdoA (MazF antagonist)